MKAFSARELWEAIEHAVQGNQALHLHSILTADAPSCFVAAVNRGEPIAHLFDQKVERLTATARRLGVRVIVIEHQNTDRQHIDLCGAPLRKAIAESKYPSGDAQAELELFARSDAGKGAKA